MTRGLTSGNTMYLEARQQSKGIHSTTVVKKKSLPTFPHVYSTTVYVLRRSWRIVKTNQEPARAVRVGYTRHFGIVKSCTSSAYVSHNDLRGSKSKECVHRSDIHSSKNNVDQILPDPPLERSCVEHTIEATQGRIACRRHYARTGGVGVGKLSTENKAGPFFAVQISFISI